MARVLPPLVYLLFFLHLPSGSLWSWWWLIQGKDTASCCQANCMEKKELTCFFFKMINFMAPHSSSGSSWPTFLAHCRVTSLALPVPFRHSSCLEAPCVVRANEGLSHGWAAPFCHQAGGARERQRAHTQTCVHWLKGKVWSSQWDHSRDLCWMIVRRSKGPEPMVNSRTIWG